MRDPFTETDLRHEIALWLAAGVMTQDFDADGIVADIQREYGTVSIATIPDADFNRIIDQNSRAASGIKTRRPNERGQ